MSSLDEDTFGTAKFVFDDTDEQYQSTSDGGVTYFASATRYRPPQVVLEIATDDQPERRAGASRRVLRRQQPPRGRPGRALRQGLLRPGQPPVLVEPRRARHVAARRGQRRDRQRVPAVGDHRVRRHQPARPDQRLRPGQDPGVGAGAGGGHQLRVPVRGQHLRLPRAEGVDGVGARSPLRRDARPGPRLAGGDRRDGRWSSPPIPSPTRRSPPSGPTTARPATGPARRRCPARRSTRARRCTSTNRSGTRPPTRSCGACSGTGPSPTPTCPRTTSTRCARWATGPSPRSRAATSRCGRGGPRRGVSTTRRWCRPTG